MLIYAVPCDGCHCCCQRSNIFFYLFWTNCFCCHLEILYLTFVSCYLFTFFSIENRDFPVISLPSFPSVPCPTVTLCVVGLGPSGGQYCCECRRHDHSGVCSLTYAAPQRHVPQQTPLRLAPRCWLLKYTSLMNCLLSFSVNSLLFAFVYVFSGLDIKGGMVTPHPTFSTTTEEHTSFYFSTYSRDFLVQVIRGYTEIYVWNYFLAGSSNLSFYHSEVPRPGQKMFWTDSMSASTVNERKLMSNVTPWSGVQRTSFCLPRVSSDLFVSVASGSDKHPQTEERPR